MEEKYWVVLKKSRDRRLEDGRCSRETTAVWRSWDAGTLQEVSGKSVTMAAWHLQMRLRDARKLTVHFRQLDTQHEGFLAREDPALLQLGRDSTNPLMARLLHALFYAPDSINPNDAPSDAESLKVLDRSPSRNRGSKNFPKTSMFAIIKNATKVPKFQNSSQVSTEVC